MINNSLFCWVESNINNPKIEVKFKLIQANVEFEKNDMMQHIKTFQCGFIKFHLYLNGYKVL